MALTKMPSNSIITTNGTLCAIAYMKRSLTIYILFFLIFVQSVNATTIIAVRTIIGNVFIGADSKEDIGNNLACKIKQFGNLFFAFSGRPNFGQKNVAMFDALLIAKEAAKTNGSVRAKINYFDRRVQSSLQNVIGHMFRNNRPLFNEVFDSGKRPALAVVIGGILNQKPAYFIRVFHIGIIKNTGIKISTQKIDTIDQPSIDIVGTYGAIERFASDVSIPKNPDPSKVIAQLITLQSEATPAIVGLPVDIIRITRKGAKWIQHKTLVSCF